MYYTLLPLILGLFCLRTCFADGGSISETARCDCAPDMGFSTLIASSSGPNASQAVIQNSYRYPQVPLAVLEYPSPPHGLELQQVHVYIRHGERTPVGVPLASPPASISEHWNKCKAARRSCATISNNNGPLESSDDEPVYFDRFVERLDGTTVADGECLLGQLTDLGRQSTYMYGRDLRKLYLDRLGLLPDILNSTKDVYFRATNMPRTMESLQQLIQGLYPSNKCRKVVPTILVRNAKDENLAPSAWACKRLEQLLESFAQAAASAFSLSLGTLDKKLSKYIGGNPLRLDGYPRASVIMDTIRASLAHGIQVPPEFEDKSVIDILEKAVVTEWFGDKTDEVRRLGIGKLLGDLSQKLQHKAVHGDADQLKLLAHAVHDVSLGAICSTFDVFDDQWPAFTASIVFELFKKSDILPMHNDATQQLHFPQANANNNSNTDQHYVRVRYQSKNLFLPICAEEGKHLDGSPEFCSLTAFKARVSELTPTDWAAECSVSERT